MTKSNNTTTKRQRAPIQGQKTKSNNTATKRKRTTIQRTKDKEQQYSDQ